MSRATLAPLILLVRALIDDPAGGTANFSDDEIQRALDARREEARYVALTELPTIQAGGVVQWLTFDAPCSHWEEGETIVDASWATITPATTDRINGRWTTTTQPLIPLRILGFTFDLYGSASDLLVIWSLQLSDAFDVSADGVSLARSQKATMMSQRALDYLAHARARISDLVRTDEAN